MLEVMASGKKIYYRGYLINEDIRAVCYTVYGVRPGRREMASVGSSRQAMEWIDRDVAGRSSASLMVWPHLFAGTGGPCS